MAEDIVKKTIEKLNGKKARYKSLDGTLQGTKVKKLQKDVKKTLEEHFKVKLDKVRVHTGGNATELCKKLKSKAFTMGMDIAFKKPADAADKKLLAHELTHVLQQTRGKKPKVERGRVLVSK